jgi:hypothetical protein
MEKITLKAADVINNFIQAVLELIQVMDLSEEQQKMGVYCVEYILDWSINGPIRCME